MLVNFTEEENVTWPHIHSVYISILFEFLCRLVSHPCCMGLYAVRVSISLDVTSGLCWSLMLSEFLCHLVSLPFCMGSLCCPSFYVTWSRFHYVWFSMFSKFLCHLFSFPFCGSLCFLSFYGT